MLSGSAVGNNLKFKEVTAEKFVHRIQQIHETVHENLKKSHAKYKERHDISGWRFGEV